MNGLPWKRTEIILLFLPCRPPGDLPNPGIKPRSPHSGLTLSSLSHQGSLSHQDVYVSVSISLMEGTYIVSTLLLVYSVVISALCTGLLRHMWEVTVGYVHPGERC